MKKLITSVFFALLSIGVSKAQISAGSLQKSFCEVSSPEAFAMTKYGATHSSMYTGAFSYNIPIYTYKDIDFEIPISLGYHFDGFRPLQGSGSMGYGWYLNVGGAITREVRGVPDEHHASESVSGDDCSGYYYFKNSGKEPTSDIVSIGSGLFSGGSVRLDKAVGAYFYGTRSDYVYEWNLLGEKTKTIERQVAKSGSSTEYIHVMNYDARGRLSSEEESLDGWQFDSTVFRYDELGRLKSKITNGILSEEYKYDIQNWQITHALRRSINTQNEQLFEQNNVFTYSGKISETEVKHKDADPFNDGYLYDGLGRLSSTTRGENYEYDLNSNVLRYNQSAYSYDGNHRIADTYNERGQLTKDAQRKIRIEYNIGGLPSFANKEDVSKLVEYSYFADGSKYSAISRGGGGYVYRGNFVFSVNSNASGNEYIESIKTKNGRIINEDGGPKYIHFTNDLIGSSQVLVELTDSQSSIREQDSYLPYGRRYIDADYRTESNNRYRFSGKEEQRVGWVDTPYIDFGARFYNPENGSWLAPDAKSISYPHLSPYSYCGGDPINYYDPDGNWIETASDVINVGLDIKDLRDAIKDGNVAGIVLNSIATVYDVAAAAVPFLPGGAGRILNGTKIGEKTASAVDVAILGIKENARSSMFRRHFIKQFGKEGLEEGVEYEVHHVFPVKFAKEFRDAGMKDINLPEYGAWVKKEEHRHTAYEYNKAWEKFFKEKKKNGEVVTLKDILAYGKVLSGTYHFETKY